MKERTTISIFRKTYEKLLKEKLEKQLKIGKPLTWDEFFTIKRNC